MTRVFPTTRIAGREILDSRGNPTIEVDLIELDGTPSKSRLGANAILGVSMAAVRAGAAAATTPLDAHLASIGGGRPAGRTCCPRR